MTYIKYVGLLHRNHSPGHRFSHFLDLGSLLSPHQSLLGDRPRPSIHTSQSSGALVIRSQSDRCFLRMADVQEQQAKKVLMAKVLQLLGLDVPPV